MLVRTESIITQLVFDHSLRVRMKSETPAESPSASRATTAAHTPDNASIAEEGGSDTPPLSEEETVRASTISGSSAATKKGKDKDAKKGEEEKAPAPAPDSGNLIGKINNLVTTDLNTLIDGRDFLFPLLFAPAQIAVSVYFLYSILGWR